MKSQKYPNNHTVSFTDALDLPMSAAPEFNGDAACVNPEQAMATALSSCHMMTFLALAAKAKWPVTAYSDRATAGLTKMEDGRLKVGKIALNPTVTFAEDAAISSADLQKMRDRAHRYCFVANSLDLEMTVNVQEAQG